MSHSHLPQLESITLRLLAVLEQYEPGVSRLVREWAERGDMDHYARVSRQIDEIRGLCAEQPQLSVHWVSVLISHAELMHGLWRASRHRQGRPAGDNLEQHLSEHRHCVAALRSRCRRLLTDGARRHPAQ
jgi:hypothetical protein